eukprot:14843067-Alexandrium_andersonii.AAC.1
MRSRAGNPALCLTSICAMSERSSSSTSLAASGRSARAGRAGRSEGQSTSKFGIEEPSRIQEPLRAQGTSRLR